MAERKRMRSRHNMNKLGWVLLPLLIAALVTGALALRGRLPARAQLNAWSSLLLLIYLLTTASLGIFWVANQHLPVFDWHYLFGYATVLLVALHLAFNLRALLGTLRPRRATGGTVRRRRLASALALGGLLAASGGAYWLGLRHGRTELRIAGRQDAAQAVVEAFHAHSAHSRAGVLRRAGSTDWGDAPPAFRHYAGRPLHPLPPPVRHAAARGLHAAQLATLLWSAIGVTQQRGGLLLRAAPSSGALFATELYLLTRGWLGVPAGVWHVARAGAELRALGPAQAAASLLPPGVPAALVATAVFARSGHKYGERTYRYVLADLGHALENLRVAAAAMGLRADFVTAFDEAAVARALALDERVEGVLAQLWLGAAAGAVPAATTPGEWRSALADDAQPLGMTQTVHRATSLRTHVPSPGVAQPAPPWPPLAADPGAARIALAARARPLADPLALIAARRSQRRYRVEALPLALLAELLHAMAAPSPLLSNAVRVHVVAHAVQGLAPGAWRYDPVGHALLASPGAAAAERRRTRAAALDQDAAGDAAAVLVLTLDRAALAQDGAGFARGWRHGFLQAGMLGERLYLQAQRLGVGVCAMGAFYDDEASALIGVDAAHEWVVHFAALGWPA